MKFLLFVPFLVGVALCTYSPYVDVDQMYRMDLVADLINNYMEQKQMMDDRNMEDSAYWPDLNDMVDEENEKMAIYNDPFYSGAHLRDQEHLEHSALHGYQSVSGGTPEGSQGTKQVKTDKQLPAYCNPPNPCPVGKTAKDNCVENFENSAENNQRLLSEQECPCDTEHMFTCPAGSQTVSSKGQGSNQQMVMNKVIDELAKMEHEGDSLENNPKMSSAQKRLTVVAKKSPHAIFKRSEISDHGNPFFQGERIAIAAKKDPNLAKTSMHDDVWE